MKTIFTWLGTVILFSIPFLLPASTVKTGEHVVIDQPVGGNLYCAGGELLINAPVGGDLVGAGGQIRINAPVGQDLLIVGGEISVQAEIGGDVRVGGGKIMIAAPVRGDIVVTGGEIVLQSGAPYGGDLIVAGGKVIVNGDIAGDVRVAGGEIVMNGAVGGRLEARGGKMVFNGSVRGPSTIAVQELILGTGVAFYSNVEYWREGGEIDFGDRLRDGATARFNPDLKVDFNGFDKEKWQRFWFLFSVYRFVAGILLILLLVAAFHRFFARYGGKLTDAIASSLGYGVLYLIGVPVLAVLAFATIIGIPIGFIMTAGYGISLALAGALVAVVLAYEARTYLAKDWDKGMMMLVAIGFSLLLRMVNFIPVVGWLVSFLLIIVVFGFLIRNIREERRRRKGDPDLV